MTKKEAIWREILFQARVNKKTVFTQKELAADFGLSLSTVFNSLKTPREAHIVLVSGRNFRLESYAKLLYLWATERSLARELLASFRVPQNASDIESSMPPDTLFGLYSGVSYEFGTTPADYDHIYVYAEPDAVDKILSRFPEARVKDPWPNLFILKKDPWLTRYPILPLEQTFADFWNAPEWYAKDFLKFLEEKLPLE